MRTGTGSGTTGLIWLLSDHLGSTSKTFDPATGATTDTRYLPWGETRPNTGTTLTDRKYTGQREDSYINLYWYGSRWYDPALGRFISPDSIVPDTYNPLAYDRYSYVYNNCMNMIDPTGHCGEKSTPGEGISQQRHDRLCKIHDEALRLSALVKAGEMSDLDALALLLEFVSPLYMVTNYDVLTGRTITYQDLDGMANDLGVVVGGAVYEMNGGAISDSIRQGGSLMDILGRIRGDGGGLFRTISAGDASDPLGQYYVGFGAFGSSGFNGIYQDGSNQVRHFLGAGLAGGWSYGQQARDFLNRRESGPNDPDVLLNNMAFQMGNALSSGALTIDQAGDWVRINLR